MSTPLPILLVVCLTGGLVWAGFQIHGVLESAFSQSLLGSEHPTDEERGFTEAGSEAASQNVTERSRESGATDLREP